MLILDDRIEPTHHIPEEILSQLLPLTKQFSSVLLDFQRRDNPLLQVTAQYLSENLPCPVAVTPHYANVTTGPLLLPPPPHHLPLEEYLHPWQPRPLWLELATEATTLSITSTGCQEIPATNPATKIHHCEDFHTHYQIALTENAIHFTFHRTEEDLRSLIDKAEQSGVKKTVGLYQQLWNFPEETTPSFDKEKQ
jgi:hypothetical protein